jgi:uncharacterized protein
MTMPPTLGHGKICYVEIPADDIERSSAFYEALFGWTLRRRGDGAIAFDDGVGEVSGTWVTGRPPSREAGLLLSVMVDSEITAWIRDPAGNVIGLYQEPEGLTAA